VAGEWGRVAKAGSKVLSYPLAIECMYGHLPFLIGRPSIYEPFSNMFNSNSYVRVTAGMGKKATTTNQTQLCKQNQTYTHTIYIYIYIYICIIHI